MKQANKKTNVVAEWLSEVVNYGGERMPRGRMLALLTESAKSIDPSNWRMLVDRYLQGQELLSRLRERERRS